jgi:hypothetical protein
MRYVRRFAIVVIVLAALVTLLAGGAIIATAIDVAQRNEWGSWPAFGGAAGILGVLTGAGCAYCAARDLPRGTLSRRATLWTWAATAGFTALAFVSVWWFVLGLIGPFVTLAFVRLSGGRYLTPAHGAA